MSDDKPTGWQDISTAPRDGTPVDLLVKDAEWDKGDRYEEFNRFTDCQWFTDHWHSGELNYGDGGSLSEDHLEPTHWMHRPAPLPKDT